MSKQQWSHVQFIHNFFIVINAGHFNDWEETPSCSLYVWLIASLYVFLSVAQGQLMWSLFAMKYVFGGSLILNSPGLF